MSTAPATAASRDEGASARFRSLVVSQLFALLLLMPKILEVRRNPQSWMAFRVFLGFAGAALVILPVSLWNSWLAAIAGLAMFLAAILLPPPRPSSVSDDKARELSALAVVNGGTYQPGNAAPAHVRLFVGAERIWALDSHFHPLLVIPAAEITSVNVVPEMDRWILHVRWADNSAEFSYQGIFAEPFSRLAQGALSSVMHPALPLTSRARAAGA